MIRVSKRFSLVALGLGLSACSSSTGGNSLGDAAETTVALAATTTSVATITSEAPTTSETPTPPELSDDQRTASFGEIVSIIQDFEIPTQSISGDVRSLLDEFDEWLIDLFEAASSSNESEADEAFANIELTRSDLHGRSISMSNTYLDEVDLLRAQVFALRVEDDEIKELRDITLRHFEAWRTCGPANFSWFRQITGIAFDDPSVPLEPGWSELWTQSQDEVKGEPCRDVSPTFRELCTALGDLQPSDLSFRPAVVDICDD